ncbi:SRPBCC family protein [Hyunsoonleella ulvae]|uniref:SRPBCC family protein n=1 Tax=Hyunsoonleella ulvae TaxID=2799948 RepID=UPI0019394636|nr:SRPBCC domain-containing protein [Hyunsoonleella ulvae]
MKDVITKEVVFSHNIDQVWNAITKAEEISTWFIQADFKAKKGYKYVFTAPPNDNGCTTIHGEIVSATPYTLIYTWIEGSSDVETSVKWELQSTPQGTKLTLEHSGISNYAGETAIAMFQNFNGGWDNCISGLTSYLKNEVNAG